MTQRPPRRDDYTVGWVSALPLEHAAAEIMLDERYGLEADGSVIYVLGRIGKHNVVLACLPSGRIGSNAAAIAATQLRLRYRKIRFGLMVGIGGGVPSVADVRLGDVVISQPQLQHGGVLQWDFGKTTAAGFERTGCLSAPPTILLTAISILKSNRLTNKSTFSTHLEAFSPFPDFSRQSTGPDVLFNANYEHGVGKTCDGCDRNELVTRALRGEAHQGVVIHYGTIASGNQAIKKATMRDEVSSALGGVLCFEMEAAGLMNDFPCLVIRGICNYADTHENNKWDHWAAATAAACGKEILEIVPREDVEETSFVPEASSGQGSYPDEIRRYISGNVTDRDFKRRNPHNLLTTVL